MPEIKPAPTTEAKKPDAAAKAPDTTKPIETKQPAVATPTQVPKSVEEKQNEAPKEPPKVPPAPPTTMPPPAPKEVTTPKQPVEKIMAVEPMKAEEPKPTTDSKKPTAAEKSGEKKPNVKVPATDPKPKPATEAKKPSEKPAPHDAPKGTPASTPKKDVPVLDGKDKQNQEPSVTEKAPLTPAQKARMTHKERNQVAKDFMDGKATIDGKPIEPLKSVPAGAPKAEPAKDPTKAEEKTPSAAPKDKATDAPKKDAAPPLKVTGKDKVEIPIPPKPAEKSEPSTAPKATQPTPLAKENTSPQGEPKVKEAAAPTQAAEGPKGIVISQVFDDRLAPPSASDLTSLPIPKEGEAFSMRLHPAYFFEFLEHPFTINRETKDYKDLYESIKENGIHDPVYCRPRKDGGLEIMSGHRRHDIGTQLNYPIPTIIVQADDDTARIAVVDGNLHRLDIPTSELARAAKMKMEALTRKAGRRSKMDQLTAPQKRSDQQVAEDMGMSRNQVQRLVRIDSLVPELKQQVDEKKLPFNTAVELSYMKPDEQKKVVDYMEKEQVTPSMSQATQLKEASKHAETLAKHMPTLAPANQVNEEKIASIIKPKKEPELKVTLTADELRSYFPGKLPTVPEAKRAIFDALDLRKKALEKQAKKQDIKPPAR